MAEPYCYCQSKHEAVVVVSLGEEEYLNKYCSDFLPDEIIIKKESSVFT